MKANEFIRPSINESAMSEIDQDLRSMSAAEFLKIYNMSKDQMRAKLEKARAGIKPTVKEAAGLGRPLSLNEFAPVGVAENDSPKQEILFYAKIPDGSKVYARVKDEEQWAKLQQQYRGAEIKSFDYRRPDILDWLEARGINLRKFAPGMVQTMYPGARGMNEFAPPGRSDGGDDGFSEDTLKRLAAQWWNGDEDPRVEQTLMSAGWEIGQDEGYDNGGVFVVQAGDINGNSYISWPAEELEQGLAEGLVKGEYGRVLDALQLYYPRLSMEELNVPGYHKVVADKANVPVEYAARVINDFVRDNDPDEDEFGDFNDDEQGVTEGRDDRGFFNNVEQWHEAKSEIEHDDQWETPGFIVVKNNGNTVAKWSKADNYGWVDSSGQEVVEGSTNHAELAKMAHDAYVAATRKGNGPMAAHYLKQHMKHKADAAKAKTESLQGGILEQSTRLDPKCWTGKKIGNPKTKVKGGVRVNNCVPVTKKK